MMLMKGVLVATLLLEVLVVQGKPVTRREAIEALDELVNKKTQCIGGYPTSNIKYEVSAYTNLMTIKLDYSCYSRQSGSIYLAAKLEIPAKSGKNENGGCVFTAILKEVTIHKINRRGRRSGRYREGNVVFEARPQRCILLNPDTASGSDDFLGTYSFTRTTVGFGSLSKTFTLQAEAKSTSYLSTTCHLVHLYMGGCGKRYVKDETLTIDQNLAIDMPDCEGFSGSKLSIARKNIREGWHSCRHDHDATLSATFKGKQLNVNLGGYGALKKNCQQLITGAKTSFYWAKFTFKDPKDKDCWSITL